MTDLGADGPGRDRANAHLLLQALHFHVVGGQALQALLHLANPGGQACQFLQVLVRHPTTLGAELGGMTQPMVPGLRPGIHPLGGHGSVAPGAGPARAAWWPVVVRSTASGNEPRDATPGCVGAPAIPAADNRSAPNPPPTGRPDNPFYRGSVSCAARSRGEPDPPTSPRN